MKMSTRVRIGIRIMVQVASEEDDNPVFARRIAERQGISQAYVDQLLLPLKAAGLLKSVRGRFGGYRLGNAPEKITALDVVEALDGKLVLVDCVEDPHSCQRKGHCPVRVVWHQLSQVMRETLASTTLETLRQEQHALDAVNKV